MRGLWRCQACSLHAQCTACSGRWGVHVSREVDPRRGTGARLWYGQEKLLLLFREHSVTAVSSSWRLQEEARWPWRMTPKKEVLEGAQHKSGGSSKVLGWPLMDSVVGRENCLLMLCYGQIVLFVTLVSPYCGCLYSCRMWAFSGQCLVFSQALDIDAKRKKEDKTRKEKRKERKSDNWIFAVYGYYRLDILGSSGMKSGSCFSPALFHSVLSGSSAFFLVLHSSLQLLRRGLQVPKPLPGRAWIQSLLEQLLNIPVLRCLRFNKVGSSAVPCLMGLLWRLNEFSPVEHWCSTSVAIAVCHLGSNPSHLLVTH